MANPIDHQMMARALDLARISLELGELPVGAVIADRAGAILGQGWKVPEKHWRLDHAEYLALRAAIPARPGSDRKAMNAFLAGLTVYTTLEPCIMCLGAITNCRVSRVVYALEDPYGGGVRMMATGRPPRHTLEYPDLIGGVLRERSLALHREYFRGTKDAFWRNSRNPLVQLCMGSE